MKHAEQLERCKKNLCPKCGSDQVEGREVEIIRGTARQDVSCLECEAEWAEFYTMDDFSLYEVASEEEEGDEEEEPCNVTYAKENPR